MKRVWILLCLVLTVFAGVGATKISYQGAASNNGSPLSGQHIFVFRLFDGPSAGNLLWTDVDTLDVQSGRFNAALGDNTPLPTSLFGSQTLWLELDIDGQPILSRQPLYPAHAAVYADSARVAGSSVSGNPLWSTDGTNVWRSTGDVGIGVPNPTLPLEVRSSDPGQVGYFHSSATSGTNYGIDAGAQGNGADTNIGGRAAAAQGEGLQASAKTSRSDPTRIEDRGRAVGRRGGVINP